MESRLPPRFAHPLPWILLGIGLLMTAIAWRETDRAARLADAVQQDALAARARARVDGIVRENVAVLDATAGFFDAIKKPALRQYVEFAARQPTLKKTGAIAGTGFAIADTPYSRAEVAAYAPQSGTLRWSPAADPQAYRTPVLFNYPDDAVNRQVVGFDMISNGPRRPFIERSIATGRIILTAPLQLVGETDPNRKLGFLTYQAVYRSGGVPPEPERRRDLRGIVYTAFSANAFFGDAFKNVDFRLASIRVYDGDPRPESLLHDNGNPPAPGFTDRLIRVPVLDREWTISIRPALAYQGESNVRLVPFVPVAGSLFSILVFTVALVQRRGRLRAEFGRRQLAAEVEVRRRAESELHHMNENLERIVEDRTRALELANQEMESFIYSVSHDLRAPLRSVDGFSYAVLEDYGDKLDEEGRDGLQRVRKAAARMDGLITSLLTLSRVNRAELNRTPVNVSELAEDVATEVARAHPRVHAQFQIQPGMIAQADEKLLHIILTNLVSNAVKFSRDVADPEVEIGRQGDAFYVRDYGAGFDMKFADKLFKPFERLHSPEEFDGTGIGAATVARIVARHGGRVWAEGEVGKGATFWFTLEPDSSTERGR